MSLDQGIQFHYLATSTGFYWTMHKPINCNLVPRILSYKLMSVKVGDARSSRMLQVMYYKRNLRDVSFKNTLLCVRNEINPVHEIR